jgi:hypothetical protein
VPPDSNDGRRICRRCSRCDANAKHGSHTLTGMGCAMGWLGWCGCECELLAATEVRAIFCDEQLEQKMPPQRLQ